MSYTHYPYQPAPKPAWYKRLFGLCKRHPIITALFIIAFLEIGAAGSITAASQVTTSTPAAQGTPSGQAVQTHKVVVTPTAASTVQAVTHGTPQIGGLLSDFYGKYGTPHNQGIGNSETWLVSSQPLILVNADHDASGKTTNVGVTEQDMNTGTTWSKDQMINYCAQFMPGDATAFNSVGDYNQGGLFIDYHSSIGEIVDLLAQGSCVITMSNS